jgi:RNA polymerase sigma factor (TIGR02999 family)
VSDVTRIFDRAKAGDPKAAEELLPLVYEDLRRFAVSRMAHDAPGQTLQPTALVHEAWLRLSAASRSRWRNREQFYAMAAEVMRRLLVDRERRRRSSASQDSASLEPAGLPMIGRIAPMDVAATVLDPSARGARRRFYRITPP